MNRTMIYRKTVLYGNKEIAYLVTRSMMPDKGKGKIGVDVNRLKNELKLYKYHKEKSFPSILSALIPLIIANSNIEKSFDETAKLFELIRKKITLNNRIGINLLCQYLYNIEEFEEKFSQYTLIDASKEEEVAFQKEKINIIMKKKTVFESIIENLEEAEPQQNTALLQALKTQENESTSDDMMMKMENYFDKISKFSLSPKVFEGAFNICGFIGKKTNDTGFDALLGEYKVTKTGTNEISLKTKRGEIDLCLPDDSGQNKNAGEYSPPKELSVKQEEDVSILKQRFGIDGLAGNWGKLLDKELQEDYFKTLLQKVDVLYRTKTVFPKQHQVFRALKEVPYEEVRVVILGQDPYHGANQANGLCFSVNRGIKAPPSLMNIFKEIEQEYGKKRTDVDLIDWARQGVLMLNAVLSVQESSAGSHAKMGWERFTDRVIEELSKRNEPMVFILWGNYAISKAKNVDLGKHLVLQSAHPSPLSCRSFFGNNHFILTNQFLKEHHQKEIVWV